MKTKNLFQLLFVITCGTAFAQNVNVQKAAGTNAITGNLTFGSGRNLNVAAGATLTVGDTTPATLSGSAGDLSIVGAGTNQNITVTSSGTGQIRLTGHVLAAGLAVDGTGQLQFPASTANTGGIGFNGGTVFLFSNTLNGLTLSKTTSDNQLILDVTAAQRYTSLYWENAGNMKAQSAWDQTNTAFYVGSVTSNASLILTSGAGSTAYTYDSAQNGTAAGTINHAGLKIVSTQFDATTTTLATVTGLSVAVVAGKTYKFRAVLHVAADAVGGLKYTVAGTATATSVIWQQIAYNAATGAAISSSRTTSLGTTSNFITTTSDFIAIDGSIVVNAGGTLVIQAAQQAANGTSSVLIGSNLEVFGG